MKILFLDIDGVLNSRDYFSSNRYLKALHRQKSRDEFMTADIDENSVKFLNKIIKNTNAKVVISSTWREMYDISDLQWLLLSAGFKGEIIDRTPMGSEIDPEIVGLDLNDIEKYERGYEIQQWMIQTKLDINTFAVVDDYSDMSAVKNNFVQTDSRVGLTDNEVDKLIQILNA